MFDLLTSSVLLDEKNSLACDSGLNYTFCRSLTERLELPTRLPTIKHSRGTIESLLRILAKLARYFIWFSTAPFTQRNVFVRRLFAVRPDNLPGRMTPSADEGTIEPIYDRCPRTDTQVRIYLRISSRS
jgi:hypothetical protein